MSIAIVAYNLKCFLILNESILFQFLVDLAKIIVRAQYFSKNDEAKEPMDMSRETELFKSVSFTGRVLSCVCKSAVIYDA